MIELIKLNDYPVRDVLKKLLADKTTKRNIIFATDTYNGYDERTMITEQMLHGFDSCEIQPRVYKSAAEQGERTRKKAEVFTPAWIVNKMNNHLDAEWFGRENVFNTEDGLTWVTNNERIVFPEGRDWKAYVDSRRLEITCGEAPYIISRYDSTTGELIPTGERIGLFDRKMRVVNENAADGEEWLKWSLRALQSVYGYEFQGDNLLIARINLLNSFCDYYEAWFGRQADKRLLENVANIIVWNLWQMNGMNDSLPYQGVTDQFEQLTFFEIEEQEQPSESDCIVFDWRGRYPQYYKTIKKRGKGMKFDYVIGNPPYQDETVGDQKQFAPPIYNLFMDSAYSISKKSILITPARFLFNAGGTPKEWNQKMLQDTHFKVLFHEQDSSKVFKNTDIKGGIAITYRDSDKEFGAITIYTPYPELNDILHKVKSIEGFEAFSNIIANRGLYRFSKLAYTENPDEMKKISDSRIGASSFERLNVLFFEEKPNDSHDYIQIFGLLHAKRVYRWMRKEYFKPVDSFDKFKLMFPAANGSGALGEALSLPVIGRPFIGHTETFLSIGSFDNEEEAKACYKYVCTKFCRTMLGVLKITQHNSAEKWAYVPLQDFTPTSDIDWSKSVADIDRQLYAKYSLSQEEIDFIETHVKEME